MLPPMFQHARFTDVICRNCAQQDKRKTLMDVGRGILACTTCDAAPLVKSQ